MASNILKHQSTTKPGRRVLLKDDRKVLKSITIKSTVTDAGNSGMRTTILRPGLVLVKKTSDGLYYLADESTADRATAPSITSSGHTDGNGVIKIVGNHGTISVTTTTGSGTEANNATDLNADAVFKAHYIASSAANELTIAARNPGASEWFYVHTDTMATAAFSEGESNAVAGTDADYVVLEDYVDMLDESGTASDAVTVALETGYFFTTNLLKLTEEAEATLRRRGALFGTT